MRIIYDEYQILPLKPGYGYVTKKFKSNRWIAIAYHPYLNQAVEELFLERVRTETSDHIIDAIDKASAALSSAELIKHIDQIGREIREALDGI